MPDIKPSYRHGQGNDSVPPRAVKVLWETLTETDSKGIGAQVLDFPDKTVHITGNFGGAAIAIEGSNNSTNGIDGDWKILTDPQGTTLSKTQESVESIREDPLWIRPNVTGGAAVDVDVTIIASRPR